MRVIAGKARSIPLKTVEGMDTRPTTDRIKETLFNMISHRLADTCFLDLFAGSGGIGIEAISRGAEGAVFIEKNPKAVECIRENLKKTRFEEQATVIVSDVLGGLRRLEGKHVFEYVFMDPPYNQLLEKQVLEYLASSKLLAEDALLIVEASLDTDFSYLEDLGYIVLKRKEYKTNVHMFLEREAK